MISKLDSAHLMQILDGFPPQGTTKGPNAVTIGVFDGLHLGHKALLQRCRDAARALGGQAIVITFMEHPDQLLRGKAPPRLMTEADQCRGFEEMGMDLVVRIPFDKKTRNMGVEEFSRNLLTEGLGCSLLVLGFDSAICKDREGTLESFQALGKELGFEALRVPPFLVKGKPASSSEIRKALRSGDIPEVNRILGRPWGFEGRVQAGQKLGRKLGFPTANVSPPPILLPPKGVYIARVTADGKEHPAILNLGMRPTLLKEDSAIENSLLCEAHLLDGPIDLEDKHLRFAFLAFLRDEKRFPCLEDLRAAIARDCEMARNFFCRAQP